VPCRGIRGCKLQKDFKTRKQNKGNFEKISFKEKFIDHHLGIEKRERQNSLSVKGEVKAETGWGERPANKKQRQRYRNKKEEKLSIR